MAFKARITSVTYTVSGVDDDGTSPIDLSKKGQFQFTAEYFDDTNPTNILHTKSFQVPSVTTTAEAQAMVVLEGQRIRDARTRVNQLQSSVGATIAVP